MAGNAQISVASGVKRTVESPRMITGTTCGGGEMYRLPRGANLEETFLLSQPHFTRSQLRKVPNTMSFLVVCSVVFDSFRFPLL